jgi:hypothetical protein
MKFPVTLGLVLGLPASAPVVAAAPAAPSPIAWAVHRFAPGVTHPCCAPDDVTSAIRLFGDGRVSVFTRIAGQALVWQQRIFEGNFLSCAVHRWVAVDLRPVSAVGDSASGGGATTFLVGEDQARLEAAVHGRQAISLLLADSRGDRLCIPFSVGAP